MGTRLAQAAGLLGSRSTLTRLVLGLGLLLGVVGLRAAPAQAAWDPSLCPDGAFTGQYYSSTDFGAATGEAPGSSLHDSNNPRCATWVEYQWGDGSSPYPLESDPEPGFSAVWTGSVELQQATYTLNLQFAGEARVLVGGTEVYNSFVEPLPAEAPYHPATTAAVTLTVAAPDDPSPPAGSVPAGLQTVEIHYAAYAENFTGQNAALSVSWVIAACPDGQWLQAYYAGGYTDGDAPDMTLCVGGWPRLNWATAGDRPEWASGGNSGDALRWSGDIPLDKASYAFAVEATGITTLIIDGSEYTSYPVVRTFTGAAAHAVTIAYTGAGGTDPIQISVWADVTACGDPGAYILDYYAGGTFTAIHPDASLCVSGPPAADWSGGRPHYADAAAPDAVRWRGSTSLQDGQYRFAWSGGGSLSLALARGDEAVAVTASGQTPWVDDPTTGDLAQRDWAVTAEYSIQSGPVQLQGLEWELMECPDGQFLQQYYAGGYVQGARPDTALCVSGWPRLNWATALDRPEWAAGGNSSDTLRWSGDIPLDNAGYLFAIAATGTATLTVDGSELTPLPAALTYATATTHRVVIDYTGAGGTEPVQIRFWADITACGDPREYILDYYGDGTFSAAHPDASLCVSGPPAVNWTGGRPDYADAAAPDALRWRGSTGLQDGLYTVTWSASGSAAVAFGGGGTPATATTSGQSLWLGSTQSFDATATPWNVTVSYTSGSTAVQMESLAWDLGACPEGQWLQEYYTDASGTWQLQQKSCVTGWVATDWSTNPPAWASAEGPHRLRWVQNRTFDDATYRFDFAWTAGTLSLSLGGSQAFADMAAPGSGSYSYNQSFAAGTAGNRQVVIDYQVPTGGTPGLSAGWKITSCGERRLMQEYYADGNTSKAWPDYATCEQPGWAQEDWSQGQPWWAGLTGQRTLQWRRVTDLDKATYAFEAVYTGGSVQLAVGGLYAGGLSSGVAQPLAVAPETPGQEVVFTYTLNSGQPANLIAGWQITHCTSREFLQQYYADGVAGPADRWPDHTLCVASWPEVNWGSGRPTWADSAGPDLLRWVRAEPLDGATYTFDFTWSNGIVRVLVNGQQQYQTSQTTGSGLTYRLTGNGDAVAENMAIELTTGTGSGASLVAGWQVLLADCPTGEFLQQYHADGTADTEVRPDHTLCVPRWPKADWTSSRPWWADAAGPDLLRWVRQPVLDDAQYAFDFTWQDGTVRLDVAGSKVGELHGTGAQSQVYPATFAEGASPQIVMSYTADTGYPVKVDAGWQIASCGADRLIQKYYAGGSTAVARPDYTLCTDTWPALDWSQPGSTPWWANGGVELFVWEGSKNLQRGQYRFYLDYTGNLRLDVEDLATPEHNTLGQAPSTGEQATGPVSLPGDYLTPGDPATQLAQNFRVEYYTGGGPVQVGVAWELVDCPDEQFLEQYYPNQDLSGRPARTTCVAPWPNQSWGSGGPGLTDQFSLRWSGRLAFTEGIWRFSVTPDDGARLYLDGNLLIDDWSGRLLAPAIRDINVDAGQHEVSIEYQEATGAAGIQSGRDLVGCYPGKLLGEYYNNTGFSGTPAFEQCELPSNNMPNYEWGSSAPAPGLGSSHYGVRWSGNVKVLENGTTKGEGRYAFDISANGTVAVGLNGTALTEGTPVGEVYDGYNWLEISYVNSGGPGSIHVSPRLNGCLFDKYYAEYFNNWDWAGPPAATRCEVGPPQYYWGSGVPAGVTSGQFSARWTADARFARGNYGLSLLPARDPSAPPPPPARLWVDGAERFTGSIGPLAGTHTVVATYANYYWEEYWDWGSLSYRWRRVQASSNSIQAAFSQQNCLDGFFTADYGSFNGCTGAPNLQLAGVTPGAGPGGVGAAGSVTWTGTVPFNGDRYRFIADAESGSSLAFTVPDQPLLSWSASDVQERAYDTSAANYQLRFTYNYNGAAAEPRAYLTWDSLDQLIPAPAECPDGYYKAEYFPNGSLSGNPSFTTCEARFAAWDPHGDWGAGLPLPWVGRGQYSVRWSGRVHLEPGTYAVTAATADQLRVRLNGDLVLALDRTDDINVSDPLHRFTDPDQSSTVQLAGGTYQAQVEYVSDTGGQPVSARVGWTLQGAGGGATDCPEQFKVAYSNGATGSACQPQLQAQGPGGIPGPWSDAGLTQFTSVRTATLPAGSYRFYAVAPNGVRVLLGGSALMPTTGGTAPGQTWVAERTLASPAVLSVEATVLPGQPFPRVWWEPADATPQWVGAYWQNENELVLKHATALDPNAAPVPGAYRVTDDAGEPVAVTGGRVEGEKMILTLGRSLAADETLTVTYDPVSSGIHTDLKRVQFPASVAHGAVARDNAAGDVWYPGAGTLVGGVRSGNPGLPVADGYQWQADLGAPYHLQSLKLYHGLTASGEARLDFGASLDGSHWVPVATVTAAELNSGSPVTVTLTDGVPARYLRMTATAPVVDPEDPYPPLYGNLHEIQVLGLPNWGEIPEPMLARVASGDLNPPELEVAWMNVNMLTLDYDQPLLGGALPARESFQVSVVGQNYAPDAVKVEGDMVVLYLPVRVADPARYQVRLTYTAGATPVRSGVNNEPAPNLVNQEVEVWAADPVNLALGKSAVQSSLYEAYTAGYGVDGNRNTFFHTLSQGNPWWAVDLGAVMDVVEIRLYNRAEAAQERADGVMVLISEDGESWKNVYVHSGPSFGATDADALSIKLDNTQARYVRLQLLGTQYLHLGEVEVWGFRAPVNAALAGTATQSSSEPFHGAELGHDGNYDTDFQTQAEANPWWMVDLGGLSELVEVRLFSSEAGYADNALGLKVQLSVDGTEWTDVYVHDGSPFGSTPSDCLTFLLPNLEARYLRVQLPGTQALHLSEVEVWAMP